MARRHEDEEWNEDFEQSPVKKRTSHIRRCCADGCTSKGYRLLIAGERVQYFPFPLFDKILSQRWAAAVKLPPGIPYEKSFVCSKHFRHGDYKARSGEDSKRTLRRTAIPSLLAVVQQGKSRKMMEGSSDDTEDDDVNEKVITTLAQKDEKNGQSFTVLVVKDSGVEDEEDDLEDDPPKILQTKKVPLRCEDLIAMGPPFPWRQQGLTTWVTDRLAAHEEQLQKNRDASNAETENCQELEEKILEINEVLSNYVLKSFMGRVNISQRIKQLLQ